MATQLVSTASTWSTLMKKAFSLSQAKSYLSGICRAICHTVCTGFWFTILHLLCIYFKSDELGDTSMQRQ